MRQNRRRTRSRRSDADKIKYIRMAAIPLAVVIVLVIIIMVMDKKPDGKEAAATPGTGISTDSNAVSYTHLGRQSCRPWISARALAVCRF